MKNKRIFIFLFTITAFFSLVSCSKNVSITLIGTKYDIVSVYDSYVDPGVDIPDGYFSRRETNLNTSKLGKYNVNYNIYSEGGSIVKTLTRVVEVTDLDTPSFVQKPPRFYYVGVKYQFSDFIESYSDNYYSNSELIISPTSPILFQTEGYHKVSLSLEDLSNNLVRLELNINFLKDIKKIILDTCNVEASNTYISVDIDSNTSFTYDDLNRFHFFKNYTSLLGKSESLEVTYSYKSMNDTNIKIKIEGESDKYFEGSINFDATKNFDSLTFEHFDSIENSLNLDEKEALDEVNSLLPGFLSEIKKYQTETLGLEFR